MGLQQTVMPRQPWHGFWFKVASTEQKGGKKTLANEPLPEPVLTHNLPCVRDRERGLC